MKTGDLLKLADVAIGIFGVVSSIYCGIKCAKISQQQMEQVANMTSDMVIAKLANEITEKERDEKDENQD